MPTYEYVCTSCGHAWETEQRITADPLKTCPKCSNDTAKRQVSGGNFILKGGGWYSDLYSSPKPKSDSKAPEGKSGDSSGSSSGTKESSTPTKTDSGGGGSASGDGSGSGAGGGSSGTPSST